MTYEEFLAEWRSECADIECRTSGSTGKPKCIFLPKSEMEKSARRTLEFFGLGSDSRLHSCISPDFIGGKMMAVRSETAGCRLTWETPSNRPLQSAGKEPIDLLAVVPSQMLHILDNLHSMPEVRNFLIGGSPIPASLRRHIADSGISAWESYGMTESSSHIALRRVTVPQQGFLPLAGISVHADPESRLVIEMEGWQRLVTNDIVKIDAAGRFEVLGRADNAIITGGKKVHPEEVEDLLEGLLGCPVMLVGEPDEKWGMRTVLLVEDANRAGGRLDDAAILEECRGRLAPECVPKEICHRQLPRTANGKKLRKSPD